MTSARDRKRYANPFGEPCDESADGERLANMLVDWEALYAREAGDVEWVAEPVVPAGRAGALYAPAKEGKSLLVQYMAGRVSTGWEPFSDRPIAPISTLYLDYEMTEDDLLERVESMGFAACALKGHLHYALLPSLAPLDTREGGEELLELVRYVGARWVIIDTAGRALSGAENEADTVRAYYMHTGRLLKADGVATLRTDHAGKDQTLGQRGSSAKNDDVDLVWKLRATDDGVKLTRTHSRVGWVPPEVVLHRRDDPLSYRLASGGWPAGTRDVADLLDKLDVPLDGSRRAAERALRGAGEVGRRHEVVSAALKYRRQRLESDLAGTGDHPGDHLSGEAGDHQPGPSEAAF